MKYYVILLVSYNNGTADKKAIYEYATESEAIANFHSYMGTYMKDATVSHLCVMAINNDGGVYETGFFTKE